MVTHIITAEYQAGSIMDCVRRILYYAPTVQAARKALPRLQKKYHGVYGNFEITAITDER